MTEFEIKIAIALVSLFIGGFFTSIFTHVRNRTRFLGYTVFNERVAFSANDLIFGKVSVNWNEQEVKNLFVSTVVLGNNSSIDYSDIKIKYYTGKDCLMLTQYIEISETTYVPQFTEDYKNKIDVPDGNKPTQLQIDIYNHSREFLIPVFNRKSKIVARFLVTLINENLNPSIWMDTIHSGIRLKYSPNRNEILGVPINLTIPIGICFSFIFVIFCILFVSEIWVASFICTIVGLFAQHIAAIFYKTIRPAFNIFFG